MPRPTRQFLGTLSMNDTAEQLGIYSDVPVLARLLKIVDIATRVLFLNKLALVVWDFVWVVGVILVLTGELRRQISSWTGYFVVIVVLIVITMVWSMLMQVCLPIINQMVLGPPIFGKLGGPPRKSFFTFLRTAQAITYKFNEKDAEKLTTFNDLDAAINEATLKESYRIHHYGESPTDTPIDFDEQWATFWNDNILTLSTGTMTYRDALKSDKFASRLLPLKLEATAFLGATLVKLSQLLLLYFSARMASGITDQVWVVQAALLVSFLISIYLYITLSNQLIEIPLLGIAPAVPAKVREEYNDKVAPFVGDTVKPIEIVAKKGYLSNIRDYVFRITFGSLLNTFLLLAFLATCQLAVRFWPPSDPSAYAVWLNTMYLAVLLIPVALVIGYYATFWLLQNVWHLVAPVVAGIVGAVLPYLITYVTTGEFEMRSTKDAVAAAVIGSTAVISTTIASMIRKRIEE